MIVVNVNATKKAGTSGTLRLVATAAASATAALTPCHIRGIPRSAKRNIRLCSSALPNKPVVSANTTGFSTGTMPEKVSAPSVSPGSNLLRLSVLLHQVWTNFQVRLLLFLVALSNAWVLGVNLTRHRVLQSLQASAVPRWCRGVLMNSS